MCKCPQYRHFKCGCKIGSSPDPNGELVFFFKLVCQHEDDDQQHNMTEMMNKVLKIERKR